MRGGYTLHNSPPLPRFSTTFALLTLFSECRSQKLSQKVHSVIMQTLNVVHVQTLSVHRLDEVNP